MRPVKRRNHRPAVDACSDGAAAYRDARDPRPHRVREQEAAHPPAITERHLQAVWFDPHYRPRRLVTTDGESIAIRDPGRWNLEAGPDFLDALLVVGSDRRQLRGDVEIHLRPDDWTHHHHARDPLYQGVVAHVTYWPGRLPSNALPGGAVQLSLKDALDAAPGFFFDDIDVAAYPFTAPWPRSDDRPPPLATLDPAIQDRLIAAAGEERMRLKARTVADLIARSGAAQALYESVLAALGYQHNRAPCKQLARLVPVDHLASEAGGDPTRAYALLLGVAGLLPPTTDTEWDQETCQWVRALWDHWWKLQSRWQRHALQPRDWRRSGMRPQNHPARRLAAAAALFHGPPQTPLHERLLALHPDHPDLWIQGALGFLQVDHHVPYWNTHLSFGGKPTAAPIALLGATRRAAIVNNVLVPFLAASGRDARPLLPLLPAEDAHHLLRHTACAVFGPDYNPACYADGLRQQGMLQLFHDFCLPNRLQDLARVASRLAAPRGSH